MEKKIIFAAPANLSGDILTDEEMCRLLNVQTRTLRLWRRQKGLPFLKISSRSIRYRRADIDQWLARHSTAIAA